MIEGSVVCVSSVNDLSHASIVGAMRFQTDGICGYSVALDNFPIFCMERQHSL